MILFLSGFIFEYKAIMKIQVVFTGFQMLLVQQVFIQINNNCDKYCIAFLAVFDLKTIGCRVFDLNNYIT
jgi:hypothetical protein